MTEHRDYTLSGAASAAPVLDGAPVEGRLRVRWWAPKITTERLVELRQPSDQPALNNFLLWLALLLVSGSLAYFSWGTLWALPAFSHMARFIRRPTHVGTNAATARRSKTKH